MFTPMSGFTKLFSTIVTSSIWSEDDTTRLVWVTLLALADRDGLVEAAVPGLANAARVSVEDCERALLVFLNPDKYSRSRAFEGRRIEAVEGGWKLLNYAAYRRKLSHEDRVDYQRIKQQEYRDRQAAQPPKPVRAVFKKPTIEEVKLQAAKIGLSDAEADRFFSYYESNGWRVGKNPMRSWQAAMTTWKLNSHDRPAVPLKREFKKPTSPLIAKMRAAGERQQQAECDRDKAPL